MAAGLTVAREKLDALRAFLAERAATELAALAWQPALSLDAVLSCAGATAELVQQTDRLAPFGMGNPQPRFAFASLRVADPGTVGENHLRCRLEGADGRGIRAIAFRALDGALGQGLLAARGRAVHVAGRLELDTWRGGDAVQLLIEDAALP
jgi:single-stranded-DNA-specific exonuclease